ncbi:hypothetical protein [Streptomyces sp. TLI_146]|uniref:effector-associated constant component EACC1 n=1 Tax=Streptomyces sp. TLI_146 TaxID=1938858 RepID=UPI000C70F316|nr:hypothetical protein [Streptomyces sp. TLI_146]
MAEVRISAGSAAGATALTGWLLRDPSVARSGITIGPASTAAAPATTMGSVDTITAVANSTVSLLGLLVSTAAWRRPRGARTSATRYVRPTGGTASSAPWSSTAASAEPPSKAV